MSRQTASPEVPVDVFEGQEFEVPLADLPGAGYRWTLTEPPDGITLIDSEWAGPPSELAGTARPRTFRFRAERAGDYDLQFELVRPWEHRESATPADTRAVSVSVRPR
jgi:predicted secreted protein